MEGRYYYSREENNAVRNKVNSLIRSAKYKYYHDAFRVCTNDIKKTWSIVRDLLPGNISRKSIKSLLIDNVDVSDEIDIELVDTVL